MLDENEVGDVFEQRRFIVGGSLCAQFVEVPGQHDVWVLPGSGTLKNEEGERRLLRASSSELRVWAERLGLRHAITEVMVTRRKQSERPG